MAILLPLNFRVAKLWGAGQGTVEKHHIDEAISYPDKALDFASNFQGELMLIRLKEELSAILTDASIDVNLSCQLCLKKFVTTVEIPSAEREFFAEAPHKIED